MEWDPKTIWCPGSKQAFVISATVFCSWKAFSAETRGAYVTRGKCIRGYGTWIGLEKVFFLEKSRNRGCERILSSIKQNGKISRFQNHFSLVNYLFLTRFVWNSVRSTFRAPSNLNDAVIEETIWAIRRFKFVYVGLKQPTIFTWISVNPNPTEPNRDSFCRCRKLLRCQPWKCNPNARESCESLGLNCTAQPK